MDVSLSDLQVLRIAGNGTKTMIYTDLYLYKSLEKLFNEYHEVFSKSEFDLGETNVTTHKIDTGVARPIKQSLRYHPRCTLEAIDKQVQEMLNQKVIEPSVSPWSSNVVVVKKKMVAFDSVWIIES